MMRTTALRASPKNRGTRFDRLTLVSTLVFLFVGALIARLFVLQVLNHGLYTALAEGQYAISERLIPERGQIFFRDAAQPEDLLPLATNRELRLVYAVPRDVEDVDATAMKVAELLQLDLEVVKERLSRPDDVYEPLAHEVDPKLAADLEALHLKGIATSPETTRYYPFGDMTGPLTGFLGYQDDERVGQYGLEGFFNKELTGEFGQIHIDSEHEGRLITVGNKTIQEAKDGDSFLLNIDRTLQHTACEKLTEAVQKHGARGGQVIIVNPSTGAVLALCTAPSYDANKYRDVEDTSLYPNGAVFQEYEPGSVIKTMTLAAAMDRKLITPETTYEDTGSVKIGNFTIRNSENKVYGIQTMNQVLEESINTGAMYAVDLLGPDTFREYMEKFGFGERTGVELQGEGDGDISSLSKKGDIYPATASFGQGISVTPMQLVMAYAAIVNDGKLMEPHIVSEIIKPNGFHEVVAPKEVREVISAETARTIKAMLINVVRNGHGARADVAGYYIGGKTGTAQIPDSDGPGYSPDEHIGTFVGFGPLTNPSFVMLAKIDVPRDVRFAESSAAPLFGDLAAFLLNYYRVPPDDAAAR